MDLGDINALSPEAFTDYLGGVFEHSPWVADRAHAAGPFASVDALHRAMMAAVRDADESTRLGLLRAHPELGGHEAREGAMTPASTGEQGRLGMAALNDDEQAMLEDLNARYRDRFGFPCIIALRLHADRDSVFAEHRRRLERDRATEIAACLDQIGVITRGRLDALVSHAPAEMPA